MTTGVMLKDHNFIPVPVLSYVARVGYRDDIKTFYIVFGTFSAFRHKTIRHSATSLGFLCTLYCTVPYSVYCTCK